jgi:gamma-glutamyltranspeptidase / glutathione hydrolase / leukotriene-C4 hydrolase
MSAHSAHFSNIFPHETSRCSDIAAAILDQGGNAMDAAVAATICLGVVGPSSSGLGGGCFILGRTNTSDVLFVDSREEAPLGATENMYDSHPTASIWGGLAVAVPAELRGLYQSYQAQGGLVPWADLITPSVALAEEYVISEHLGVHIQKMSTVIEADKELFKDIRALLTHADGTYKIGIVLLGYVCYGLGSFACQ